MTNFTVAIKDATGAVSAQTTADMEEALDWIGNAIDAIFDPEDDTEFATLTIDGKVWVVAQDGGVPGPGGGEVLPLRKVG